MNSLFKILLFIPIINIVGVTFDRFSGKKVEEALSKELRLKNATERCSIELRPCSPHEGRRIDGTCNNYKSPSKGAAGGPYLRLLKPDYGTNNDYLRERQYCCQEAGRADPRCIPITVPKDDPYLKVTDITCLNFSRAETFQDSGCTPEIIPPEQINFQTPLLDLSTVYGIDKESLARIRKGELGLLILERRGDRYVPLNISNEPDVLVTEKNNVTQVDNATMNNINSTIDNIIANVDLNTDGVATAIINNATTDRNICIQNRINESICYQFGFPEAGNYNLRTTTFGIFFTREHNRIAIALHKINPCWKDDRLFKVARQINIATAANIYMYELLPTLLGYQNMINYGLISENVEHVSTYTAKIPPLVYAEFEIATRFFHTMLDGRIKRYTEKHHYTGEFSVSETLHRQALIEQDRNFEEINRGTFYQNASKIDDILDPEISENYFGDLQRAHDLGAIDIQRGRDMGIRGYNDYRHLCGLKPAKTFEELIDVMEFEKMEALKSLYEEVDDIDLLAGIISERNMQGTYVGPTLFCIMAKQLEIFRYSDRFWHERGDQFHSFSIGQLYEIRKTSIARLACDNAEGVKFIQPQAFYNVKPGNTPVPCTHIDRPDLTKWRDNSCFKHKYSHEATHVPMSFMEQGFGLNANFSRFFEEMLLYKPSDVLSKE